MRLSKDGRLTLPSAVRRKYRLKPGQKLEWIDSGGMIKILLLPPVTELKNHTKQILSRVMKTGGPVLVTQNGHSAVIIVDVDYFQRRERRMLILEKIARGEREILEGKGIPLEKVKKEVAHWIAAKK